jgi:hypothetical protein
MFPWGDLRLVYNPRSIGCEHTGKKLSEISYYLTVSHSRLPYQSIQYCIPMAFLRAGIRKVVAAPATEILFPAR